MLTGGSISSSSSTDSTSPQAPLRRRPYHPLYGGGGGPNSIDRFGRVAQGTNPGDGRRRLCSAIWLLNARSTMNRSCNSSSSSSGGIQERHTTIIFSFATNRALDARSTHNSLSLRGTKLERSSNASPRVSDGIRGSRFRPLLNGDDDDDGSRGGVRVVHLQNARRDTFVLPLRALDCERVRGDCGKSTNVCVRTKRSNAVFTPLERL